MKIALVCTEKLPVPPVAGGAVQLYIDGILPYLSKQHQITVFSIEHPGLPPEEIRDNVRHIRVPARTTAEYVENLKAKVTAEFDLVHIFNRPLWVLTLGDSLPGTRFSLSLHNEMFHPEKITDKDALRCVQRVEFINTVSRFIADGVARRVPEAQSKLRVVYSGADCSIYKPVWTEEGMLTRKALKKKLRLEGHKVVLFVGRLSEKKGVHILLKALKNVMLTDPKVALLVIGSKWYGENKTDDYTRTLQLLSNELKGLVVFTGFIPPAQIPDYYTLGDVFVCPSQWNEPLARVHYEAMAAGLPIITTNRGGNAEVVKGFGNGVVIDDYTNPLTFASYIEKMLNNRTRALEMGRTGRRLAQERYNWERVAREAFKLLEDKNKV